ncbi:LysM peptidoglycan-binding domain-containing protein [Dyella mobilis]|uniref:LysM peptidoglycan-binding domain-containing protein n=1 Tax=Dyella mobilis TaxID=1849582 RepID=A0ABS2KE36_9GAMM|nr:LysM domain-containing protein [Dyella mobilis]MBM7129426.1 LysM peptidoglycan-binding domain-containing protein [Dyella mobilis]GLQ98309.1 peptidoglycan-binding protein LysM [Dyella mobilis]
MIRKSIGLLAGMLVTVAVYAAGTQLRADHPDSYTVRRGDTLWAISARFLSKPWLWPEIWQANPQVHNPHLIYPGDVLDLSFINGGPALRLEPAIRHEGEAIPAISVDQLKPFLRDSRVVDPDEVKNAPYVMGFEEADITGTAGRNLYVRNLHAQPGQRWAIVRPTHVFRTYGGSEEEESNDMAANLVDSDVATTRSPWNEEWTTDMGRSTPNHVFRGKTLAMEVEVIGQAEVLRGGDPSTLLLLNSIMEIRAGDRLMPVDDNPYDPYYYPHPPKSAPGDGRVIAFSHERITQVGPNDVVVLSIGSKDGVDNGTTFSLWQPGEQVYDDVAHDVWNRYAFKTVTLPDEYVGHVMIFRTFDRVSYGIVMDGLKPVHIGARAKMPE